MLGRLGMVLSKTLIVNVAKPVLSHWTLVVLGLPVQTMVCPSQLFSLSTVMMAWTTSSASSAASHSSRGTSDSLNIWLNLTRTDVPDRSTTSRLAAGGYGRFSSSTMGTMSPSSHVVGAGLPVDGDADGTAEGAEDGTDDGGDDGTADGTGDGTDDGEEDGAPVTASTGLFVGSFDGSDEGTEDGEEDGAADDETEGVEDGDDEGALDGRDDGTSDGADEGNAVGLQSLTHLILNMYST